MLAILFGAAVPLTAAFGLGTAVTRRVAVPAPVRLAAGSALLGVLVFVLMAAHRATKPVLGILCAVCALLVCTNPPKLRSFRPPVWAAAIFILFTGYAAVNALAPEIEADPNIYHLQDGLDLLRYKGFSGRISFYERLPHAAELLYAVAFAFSGSTSAPRVVHLAFLIATVPLIASIGKQLGLTDRAATAGALFYYIAPVVQVAGASAFNDAALSLAAAATVSVLLASGPAWLVGLLAGACYAVKMTGGIVVPMAFIWLAVQRRYRALPFFCFAAAICVSPWLMRNLAATANPFAPFFNSWFPNPYFHISSEAELSASLRSYGVSLAGRFGEIIWGWRLHGIIGPVFLLLPLALFGARRRGPAIAIAVALILSVPWWLNAGARFLTLSLPFLALALAAVLPRAALIPVVLLHAVTVWPAVTYLYSPLAWQLHTFPWRAAIGIESPHDYLWNSNMDYRRVKGVESHTGPADSVLDLRGLHGAHISRTLSGYWQSARAENALRTLDFARRDADQLLFTMRARFAAVAVKRLRVRQTAASPRMWSVPELELEDGGASVRPDASWILDAKPNRWETPLLWDRNLATRWSSWQPAEPGQFLSVTFPSPLRLDTVRVFGTHSEPPGDIVIEIDSGDGQWRTLRAEMLPVPHLELRGKAMEYVRSLGFTHIAGDAGDTGAGLIASALLAKRDLWEVEPVDQVDKLFVFRILSLNRNQASSAQVVPPAPQSIGAGSGSSLLPVAMSVRAYHATEQGSADNRKNW